MAAEKNMRKVEAHVPRPLWDEVEAWTESRGGIPTRYLLTAMFRLFLAAPEGVKLLALYGRADQLADVAAYREDFLAAGILDAAEADEAATSETTAGKRKALRSTDGKRRRKTG